MCFKELHYLFTCDTIRVVYSEKDIGKGTLLTVYPNNHELSRKNWNDTSDDNMP